MCYHHNILGGSLPKFPEHFTTAWPIDFLIPHQAWRTKGLRFAMRLLLRALFFQARTTNAPEKFPRRVLSDVRRYLPLDQLQWQLLLLYVKGEQADSTTLLQCLSEEPMSPMQAFAYGRSLTVEHRVVPVPAVPSSMNSEHVERETDTYFKPLPR